MGTYYMHFLFFTCEVKCGSAGLDIADRQNLYSMTLAVRGVVELFRLANRAEELYREVLVFSISHDHETVRIYGHYPMIDGTKTTYWRLSLRKFDFIEGKGLEKWTAYTFMMNFYGIWVPAHFKRITSAVDDLPLQQDFEFHRGLSRRIRRLLDYHSNLESKTWWIAVSQATLICNRSRRTRQCKRRSRLPKGRTGRYNNKDLERN
jgi:hypothetical protein